MAVKQVEVQRDHSPERAWALLQCIREATFMEAMSEEDRVHVVELGAKPISARNHADVQWLAGKLNAVCSKEEPVTKTVLLDDGVTHGATVGANYRE